MSKIATISSLNRNAAKSEALFVSTINQVFEEANVERIAEFFDKLNIPRSVGAEDGLFEPIPDLINEASSTVWSFDDEKAISDGMQKFFNRHVRKVKWHAGHPSIEGAQNVLLLFRATIMVTNLRLHRLKALLDSKDELSPIEWRYARDIMNKSYLSFRNFLRLAAGPWIEAMQANFTPDELAECLGSFYEIVDSEVRILEDHKETVEDRRLQLSVLPPNGLPPVKPPVYFSGDLLGRGPWKQFWAQVNGRAHSFREGVGY